MNGPLVVVASVALAVGGAYAITAWNPPAPPVGSNPSAGSPVLEQRLRQVEDRLEQALGRVEELGARLEAMPATRTPAAPVSPEAIEAAVAKWMDAHAPAAAASSSGAKLTSREAAYARLEAAGGDFNKLVAAWKEIDEAGLEAEMLDWFQSRAAQAPGDAEAQYEYGSILIVALQNKPVSQQGPLAIKADAAFDRALEVDDHHWKARFSKATSLSFWPKITGKHTEAINHFEVLMAQQEAVQTRPEFAQTYLFLGNMYQDNGKAEDAKAIYERGLRYFPGNAGLQAQLAALGK